MKIFYDVDTQKDFMNKDGALYVPDAELIKPNLKILTDYARKKNIPIVGSVDRHFGTKKYKEREGELKRNGGPFPDHCVDGSDGQEKILETSLYYYGQGNVHPGFKVHISVPNNLDNKANRPELGYALASITGFFNTTNSEKKWEKTGLFFEKQSYDVFTNPAFEVFLKMADVKEAVVYGVATDYCVKAAVLGMQKRGINCYVVKDAIKGVDPKETESALDEMLDAMAKFVKTKDVLEGRVI